MSRPAETGTAAPLGTARGVAGKLFELDVRPGTSDGVNASDRLRWFLGLVCLWFLLVAKVDWQDMVAALALGIAVSAVVASLSKLELAAFRTPTGWAGYLIRLPASMLKDTATVFGEAWRSIAGGRADPGRVVNVPFRPGSERDPRERAREALVMCGILIEPNTFVIGVDREGCELIVHQLVPTSEPPGRGDVEWPW